MQAGEILNWIFNVVIWVIAPFILVIILFLTRAFAKRADEKRHEKAMKSGFWAGISLFLMVLIYQVGLFVAHGFPQNDIYQGFNIWLAIGVGILSFFMFMGGKKIVSPELSGFATLLITFISSYALLHYLFIRTYNELILSLTFGMAFGVLAHFANPHSFTARSLKEIIEGSSGHEGGEHH